MEKKSSINEDIDQSNTINKDDNEKDSNIYCFSSSDQLMKPFPNEWNDDGDEPIKRRQRGHQRQRCQGTETYVQELKEKKLDEAPKK